MLLLGCFEIKRARLLDDRGRLPRRFRFPHEAKTQTNNIKQGPRPSGSVCSLRLEGVDPRPGGYCSSLQNSIAIAFRISRSSDRSEVSKYASGQLTGAMLFRGKTRVLSNLEPAELLVPIFLREQRDRRNTESISARESGDDIAGKQEPAPSKLLRESVTRESRPKQQRLSHPNGTEMEFLQSSIVGDAAGKLESLITWVLARACEASPVLGYTFACTKSAYDSFRIMYVEFILQRLEAVCLAGSFTILEFPRVLDFLPGSPCPFLIVGRACTRMVHQIHSREVGQTRLGRPNRSFSYLMIFPSFQGTISMN